jgi:hypothetical protein
MSLYGDTFLSHLSRILEGKEQYIPNPHVRMQEVFNLYKGRYILIGSNSNTGKTSFIDDLLLKSYEWLRKQEFSHHFEVPYYSMERATRDKIAKWTSWKIFQDKGFRIPSNVFATGSHGNIKLTEEIKKLAESYGLWFEELLPKITIKQGPRTVDEINSDIERIALVTCDKITTTLTDIFINNKCLGTFGIDKTKLINGIRVPYRDVTINKESIEVFPNSERYVLKNPNTFVFPLIDHLGKTKLSFRHKSKKEAIDDLDERLSLARDNYYMSPIAVSQFNRAIGDITRIKFAAGDLEPIDSDFKDTSNSQESADLILGLFDPYTYKSFDKDGNYKGYNIADGSRPGTLNPSGEQMFRSVKIIKNSYGPKNITYAMKFTGEVMTFDLLPLPGTRELEKVYQEIAQGK